MKRILVVSWFYPPINSSEGLVTYKLLSNSKFKYDVCMQNDNASWSYGKNESLPDTDNVCKIAIPANTLEQWKNEVVRFFEKHKDAYDVVMTRSMPPESHEVGVRIKEIKPHIIWIASFGDPIANNPFELKEMISGSPYSIKSCKMNVRQMISPIRIAKNFLWKKLRKQQKKIQEKEKSLENAILKKCDYVILNNKYQKRYMLEAYGKQMLDKALLLYHSFDEQLYENRNMREKNGKIRMVYIGHLDDMRTPHLIFEAVARLKQEKVDLEDKLELFFYGNMSDKEKVYLLDNELLDIIHIKRPVDYKTSLAIMKESDWLIHIDANLSGVLNENIFFAAKLADYIGSGTPIFGLTMFDGAGADIVRDVNGVTVSYTVDEIKNYLYLICYKGYSVEMNGNSRDKYNAKNVAAQFDEFIESKILR